MHPEYFKDLLIVLFKNPLIGFAICTYMVFLYIHSSLCSISNTLNEFFYKLRSKSFFLQSLTDVNFASIILST